MFPPIAVPLRRQVWGTAKRTTFACQPPRPPGGRARPLSFDPMAPSSSTPCSRRPIPRPRRPLRRVGRGGVAGPGRPGLAGLILVVMMSGVIVAVDHGARPGPRPWPRAAGRRRAGGSGLRGPPRPPTTATTLPAGRAGAADEADAPPTNPSGPRSPIVKIGEIRIPKIGLVHPVYEGVTLTVVDQGPGHWPGSAVPGQLGNAVFAGHRVTHSHPFRNVDKLVAGDEISSSCPTGRSPTG